MEKAVFMSLGCKAVQEEYDVLVVPRVGAWPHSEADGRKHPGGNNHLKQCMAKSDSMTNICCVAASQRGLTSDLCAPVALETRRKAALREVLKQLLEETVEPDPRAFIALRLGSERDLRIEKKVLRRLSEVAVRKVMSGEDFPIDLLASYILAFRSACQDPTRIPTGGKKLNLVEMLHTALYNILYEMPRITSPNGTAGHFLKVLTEGSLGILTLCLEKEPLSEILIHKFARSHLRKMAKHGRKLTVEGMSTVALSLSCLIHSPQARGQLRLDVARALKWLMIHILREVKEDGTIGSLKSTGLAMQALAENINVHTSRIYNCAKSVEKMVQAISLRNLQSRPALYEAVIALNGQTYLDLKKIYCPPSGMTVEIRTTPKTEIFPASTSPDIRDSTMMNQNLGIETKPPRITIASSLPLKTESIQTSSAHATETQWHGTTGQNPSATESFVTLRPPHRLTEPKATRIRLPVTISPNVPTVRRLSAHVTTGPSLSVVSEPIDQTVSAQAPPVATEQSLSFVTEQTDPTVPNLTGPVGTGHSQSSESEPTIRNVSSLKTPIRNGSGQSVVTNTTVPTATKQVLPMETELGLSVVTQLSVANMPSLTVSVGKGLDVPVVNESGVSPSTRPSMPVVTGHGLPVVSKMTVQPMNRMIESTVTELGLLIGTDTGTPSATRPSALTEAGPGLSIVTGQIVQTRRVPTEFMVTAPGLSFVTESNVPPTTRPAVPVHTGASLSAVGEVTRPGLTFVTGKAIPSVSRPMESRWTRPGLSVVSEGTVPTLSSQIAPVAINTGLPVVTEMTLPTASSQIVQTQPTVLNVYNLTVPVGIGSDQSVATELTVQIATRPSVSIAMGIIQPKTTQVPVPTLLNLTVPAGKGPRVPLVTELIVQNITRPTATVETVPGVSTVIVTTAPNVTETARLMETRTGLSVLREPTVRDLSTQIEFIGKQPGLSTIPLANRPTALIETGPGPSIVASSEAQRMMKSATDSRMTKKNGPQ
ncbi:mucin-2-like [Narcine bancroftii]|uniref:mucin-2-like n=1 Tax=Narcine bancroftii TaxID=1343680 RepID=UPI0038317B7F